MEEADPRGSNEELNVDCSDGERPTLDCSSSVTEVLKPLIVMRGGVFNVSCIISGLISFVDDFDIRVGSVFFILAAL